MPTFYKKDFNTSAWISNTNLKSDVDVIEKRIEKIENEWKRERAKNWRRRVRWRK